MLQELMSERRRVHGGTDEDTPPSIHGKRKDARADSRMMRKDAARADVRAKKSPWWHRRRHITIHIHGKRKDSRADFRMKRKDAARADFRMKRKDARADSRMTRKDARADFRMKRK